MASWLSSYLLHVDPSTSATLSQAAAGSMHKVARIERNTTNVRFETAQHASNACCTRVAHRFWRGFMFDTCCASRVAAQILRRVALTFVYLESAFWIAYRANKKRLYLLSREFIDSTHVIFPTLLSISLVLSLLDWKVEFPRRMHVISRIVFTFFFFWTSDYSVKFCVILGTSLFIKLLFIVRDIVMTVQMPKVTDSDRRNI